jgi:hypothetical protein
MGAWDTTSFGNDTALDWVGELEECEDLSCIEDAIDAVLEEEEEYLEGPVAETAIAAAEVLACLRGRAAADGEYPEEVTEWVKEHPIKPPEEVRQRALAALERIQGEESELAELWEGNDEWKAWMADLRKRLK